MFIITIKVSFNSFSCSRAKIPKPHQNVNIRNKKILKPQTSAKKRSSSKELVQRSNNIYKAQLIEFIKYKFILLLYFLTILKMGIQKIL